MDLSEDKIIFIISLPRSGSTFLQRVLSGHADIYAQGELWLLLNFFFLRKTGMAQADYGSSQLADVANDFIQNNPEGEVLYQQLVRDFYLKFFSSNINSNKTYLVDKTPRYHMVLDELIETFPSAKFIVLYRNPIAVFGSYLNAMRSNNLRRLDGFELDLVEGPKNIASFYDQYASRCHKISYEDLVSSPKVVMQSLFDYLEVTPDYKGIDRYGEVEMEGKGDSNSRVFHEITDRSKSWGGYIDTPLRGSAAKRFLDLTDNRYMLQGGYERGALVDDLNSLKFSKLRIIEYLYCMEQAVAVRLKKLLKKTDGVSCDVSSS